ncbi:helix-turn-helix transcriptional regulator [Arthrobacter sp. H14-L1]|uniref:helix-turn-helix transcriptional regulator n=1 Tax=Arthrobacter sp. H14-L1 TaxID=2996697 RepID=UPI00226D5EEA|nr:LuxR C-terminal-related transcriptional regulator [Arthrobacter sp. H14-L1]MCY0904964.1 LuxR C-terminal-related transcriptional regulator [Arthrobacter sp. H14-L1]
MRQDKVAEAIGAVRDPACQGIAVTGAQGIGKTTLARAVETALAPDHSIVHLHGSTSGTARPYGVLAFLLARMPATISDSPAATICAITDLIRKESDGKPVLLILDSISGVDEQSLAVIMHLLLSESAKVLVVTRHESELPEDIIWLIKRASLKHVRLDVFSRDEVRQLLEGVLDGQVTTALVRILHASSGGNPLVLHATVSEQLHTGALHCRGSVWTINNEVSVGAPSVLEDLVRSRMYHQPREVRDVIEYLALARQVRLSTLVKLMDASLIAAMEESGHLSVARSGTQWVSFGEPFMGEVIRAGLDMARRRELHALFSRLTGAVGEIMTTQEILTYAAWTIDCGAPLEPSVALAAAAAANAHFDPVFALRCAEQVQRSDDQWVAAAEQRSAAYFILADHEAAIEVLDTVRRGELAGLSLPDYANYILHRCHSLLWIPGGYQRIDALLAAARDEIECRVTDLSQHVTAKDVTVAGERLALARIEASVHRGNFTGIAEELETIFRTGTASEIRIDCGSLLVLVRALTGREIDAVELAERLESDAQKADGRGIMRDWLTEGHFTALLLSGRWMECVAMLTASLDRRPEALRYRGGATELALGVAYTFAGRGDLAMDPLLSAVAQLEISSSFNAPVLAYSALAFAFAQVDDAVEARRYLGLASACRKNISWVTASLAMFCDLMARRWLGESTAKQKLVESASRDMACGRYTMASTSLFGATMHGTAEEYLLLEEASKRRQGPMAALSRLVASGSRVKDPAVLLQAADTAHELVLKAVEARCVVLAMECARESGDAVTVRNAQHRLDQLRAGLPLVPLVPHTEGPKLTPRERQVVKLVRGGLSNREMADRLEVSVRTVEGHLYQIFSKLGVRSRGELDDVP